MKNPAEKLYKIEAIFKRTKPRLLKIMGAVAIKFIHTNFHLQGFQGKNFEAWQKRKAKEKGPSRAILIKTGKLQRGWRALPPSGDSVVIANSVPWAKIHNNGGLINHPGGARTVSFVRSRTGFKFGKDSTEIQQRKVKKIWSGNIGAHNIRQPQRRMMGDSPMLRADEKEAIVKEMITEVLKK